MAEIFDISIDDLFPQTKTEENVIQKALEITGDKELSTDEMLFIKKLYEKALEHEGEDRKRLFENIDLAVNIFENQKK
ncbi:hypothetical protein AQ616_19030 [Oceanobacillus sp. E9]|uniref:hypothetical protein n=1 Tax=Oceanobacillus sp. E9 TaxID=1742575 RepID=UPI00084E7696|nr:hypothetical protein [Oceanobacillus sp. E9]OEH55932.1 hypothetical protein AQ616_19030 [Oceanobacillus sp. E9]